MGAPGTHEVAEFQGFYAPFTVTEKLLQKIWLRGDFSGHTALTTEGEAVEVLFPGQWNLLEGPDFRNARLRIGGRDVTGDIELHFRAVDWTRHGHHRDPAYDRVVLHVLLFPPGPAELAAVTSSGSRMPSMVLLELLHHDLEEYATEDALEVTLERNHWQATEELLRRPLDERRQLLIRHARLRWRQKVHFARLRVEKLGWIEACHQTAMEILGYRRNRGAMINAATRYPLGDWVASQPKEEGLLATGFWVVQGARPANHPRERLRQYLAWVAARPDWPARLKRLLAEASEEEGGGPGDYAAGPFRARRKLKCLRAEWGQEITGGFMGGTRLNTLFCDGFFPLLATIVGEEKLLPYWSFWYAGDFPERVLGTLRTAEITDRRGFPVCNGWCQGVISLSLEKRSDPLVCFEGG